MQKDRLAMLRRLQKLEFDCIELTLYLDTHPDDQRALMDYNALSCQLIAFKKQYESLYGPLMNFGFSLSQYPWRWIEDPWPWEIGY